MPAVHSEIGLEARLEVAKDPKLASRKAAKDEEPASEVAKKAAKDEMSARMHAYTKTTSSCIFCFNHPHIEKYKSTPVVTYVTPFSNESNFQTQLYMLIFQHFKCSMPTISFI